MCEQQAKSGAIPASVPLSPEAPEPFWRVKPLDALSRAEWESLCDGCGRCCLNKLEDWDTGAIAWTDVRCRLLDPETCRCADYANRQKTVPDCIPLDAETVRKIGWLPPTCGYRLVAEGRDLYWWHPLLSGDPETVHAAGISVQGRTVSEAGMELDDFEDHLASWPGEDPMAGAPTEDAAEAPGDAAGRRPAAPAAGAKPRETQAPHKRGRLTIAPDLPEERCMKIVDAGNPLRMKNPGLRLPAAVTGGVGPGAPPVPRRSGLPSVGPAGGPGKSLAETLSRWRVETLEPSPAERARQSGKASEDEFGHLASLSLAQRMRATVLQAHRLTEEGFKALPKAEQDAIEREIELAIKRQMGLDGTRDAKPSADARDAAGVEAQAPARRA